jgi:hypothetical protein
LIEQLVLKKKLLAISIWLHCLIGWDPGLDCGQLFQSKNDTSPNLKLIRENQNEMTFRKQSVVLLCSVRGRMRKKLN